MLHESEERIDKFIDTLPQYDVSKLDRDVTAAPLFLWVFMAIRLWVRGCGSYRSADICAPIRGKLGANYSGGSGSFRTS